MAIKFLSFNALVEVAKAKAQSITSRVVDWSLGSVGGAILNVMAWLADLLQGENQAALLRSRLLTCTTTEDIDSFIADFGLYRLPATTATGQVTFSRYTNTNTVQIPVGAVVKTADGSRSYTVTADTTHFRWNVEFGAYVVPVGVSTITVPVQAVAVGTAGNVQADTITVSTVGIMDTVTNSTAITNGLDAESNDAVKARFSLYIDSLSKSTVKAIQFAIASVQQNISYLVNNNRDALGAERIGYVMIWIDDGSGQPSSDLVARAYVAADETKAAGVITNVMAAHVVTANASLTISALNGYDKSDLVAPVQTAITSYINSLDVAEDLDYGRIYQVAYNSVEGIEHVTSVLINGSSFSLTASANLGQVIRAGSVVVS